MKPLSAILVDDEIAAINTLRGMLAEFCPEVNVLGEAGNMEEAIELFYEHHPDLIFLDIQLTPQGSGFDLIKAIQGETMGVIFTTAYPNYAIQAIQTVQPWYYLVKPYSVEQLKEAVAIAHQKMHARIMNAREALLSQNLIISDARKGNLVVPVREIIYLQADGGTSDLFLLRQGKLEKITSYRNLGDLESDLPEAIFFRCHHGYIVNLSHIVRFERKGRNGIIYLPEGAKVDVSVSRLDAFINRFEVFAK